MAIQFDPNFDKSNNSKVTVNGVPIDQQQEKKQFSFVMVFYWLALVAAIVMGLHAIAPIAAVLLFLLVGLFWIIVVLCPSVLTLGLIWISEEYRGFVSNLNDTMSDISDGQVIDRVLSIVYQSYWYVLGIGLAIILIGLIWSILDYKSDVEGNNLKKHRMIGLIVFSIIFGIAAFVAGAFAISAK